MSNNDTFIFENIPLCFSKYIKINDNILNGNIDKKYFAFKLSNIIITNNDNVFNLEISGTENEIKITKSWMFHYLQYLYKNKYYLNKK